MIALGFAMDKKFNLNTTTLNKLLFYIFVPAFTFVNISITDISISLVHVIALTTGMLLINFLFGAGLARVLRLPYKTRKAFENSIMFYNSGNIGLSLMTLAFSSPLFLVGGNPVYLEIAVSVQVMTVLVQNLTVNTIGFINSGGEGMTLKKGIILVLKMPTIYGVTLAILFKFIPVDPTIPPIWPALMFLRHGLIPISLITLGAQLAKSKLNFRLKTPYISALCRLAGGPALALLLINILGFEGVIAQAIFIASSTPTAINTALVSVETRGDVDFAMQAVSVSTLLSAVTMTTVIYLAYILF
jgi:predicted permease